MATLDAPTRYIKLTRIDQDHEQQTMMFIIKPKKSKSLDEIRTALFKLDPKLTFTVLQYQPLC